MAERMNGMASAIYEEFIDYWEGNYRLHRDNTPLFARMDALAHKQGLQSKREEVMQELLQQTMGIRSSLRKIQILKVLKPWRHQIYFYIKVF